MAEQRGPHRGLERGLAPAGGSACTAHKSGGPRIRAGDLSLPSSWPGSRDFEPRFQFLGPQLSLEAALGGQKFLKHSRQKLPPPGFWADTASVAHGTTMSCYKQPVTAGMMGWILSSLPCP